MDNRSLHDFSAFIVPQSTTQVKRLWRNVGVDRILSLKRAYYEPRKTLHWLSY